MKTLQQLTFALITTLTLQACGSSDDKSSTPKDQPSNNQVIAAVPAKKEIIKPETIMVDSKSFYQSKIKVLFDRSCVGCHSSTTSLDFANYPFSMGASSDQIFILTRAITRMNDKDSPMPPILKNTIPLTQAEVLLVEEFLKIIKKENQ